MKARTVPFSSLMFLKATPKELIKKRRLRDRLLMAARCAIFLLLALVFARPYLPAERIPFVARDEAESTVILVDRSFSMRHADTFERALDAVRSRLDAAGADDEVALVVFDDAPQVVAPLETDLAVHRGSLESLVPGFRTTDYFPALQRAGDLLQDARQDRRVVVLISDFQSAGWTGSLDNWKLEPGISFEPVAVGAAETSNGYVEAFQVSQRRSSGRQSIRYDARIAVSTAVAGGSMTERTAEETEMAAGRAESIAAGGRGREAALVIAGAEVDRRMLPMRASAPFSFQHVPERDGFYQGMLSLDADELPVDDRYYFTEEVTAEPALLIVDAGAGSAARDAFYLRSAFDLGEVSRYSVASGDQITDAALRNYNVVFIADRTASQTERAVLRRYAERGGTLVVSPGDATDAAALSALSQELGLGRISQVVNTREELGYEAIVGDVDVRHPIFAPFGGSGAILQPKFRRYARLEPSSGTNVVGRFDSGDPFLAERPVGRGLVLFYASTFNTSWTDMPLDEMFVPFVYQLAGYGTRHSDVRHVFTVGESVEISGDPGETWEIRAPGDRVHRVMIDEQGRGIFRETEVPGHYAAAAGMRTKMFSVNVDPRESNLAGRDPDEIYAAVVAPPNDEPRTPEQAAAAVLVDDERKQKLWKVLLLGVILLFGVETYFANRRGVSR